MGCRSGIIENDHDAAHLDGIQMFQQLPGDRLGIDESPVGAGKVLDKDPIRFPAEHGMMA